MWEFDHKEGWVLKDCFWTVVLEKTLESPLDSKEIKPVNSKGNQSWIFIGRTGYWNWTSNTLATWCEELTHWKRPWCWERLKAGEGDNWGWDGGMASLTQWTWVWASSGSWWCHPTISFSVVPFSCLQSFPASGSFPMSQFFASGDQSIGVSASASVLPMNIQGWFPLELTGLISLQFKGPSCSFRIFFLLIFSSCLCFQSVELIFCSYKILSTLLKLLLELFSFPNF